VALRERLVPGSSLLPSYRAGTHHYGTRNPSIGAVHHPGLKRRHSWPSTRQADRARRERIAAAKNPPRSLTRTFAGH